MFKNMTIMILAVLLLIVVCNSTFSAGPISFEMPARSSGDKIERRLMDAARLIEDAKTDKALKQKVDKILLDW